MGMERCLGCRDWQTSIQKVAQFTRLKRAGLDGRMAKNLLPRCEKCLNREIARNSHIRLPQIGIVRQKNQVCLFACKEEDWPGIYEHIARARASFVCVRLDASNSGYFLVASTHLYDGVSVPHLMQVAAAIEQAIIARPLKQGSRFVATRDWGGDVFWKSED